MISRGEAIWLATLAVAIAITVLFFRNHHAPCTHGDSSITATRGSDGKFHEAPAYATGCTHR